MVGVRVDRDPPFRRVQLDTGRPNVLRLETVRALKDALTPDLEAPVLMLHGRSDSFCAGLDNVTLGGTPLEREELLDPRSHRTAQRTKRTPDRSCPTDTEENPKHRQRDRDMNSVKLLSNGRI